MQQKPISDLGVDLLVYTNVFIGYLDLIVYLIVSLLDYFSAVLEDVFTVFLLVCLYCPNPAYLGICT